MARIASSPPFADATIDPANVRTLTEFSSFEGIEAHAALASGRWATAGATPQEATLSEAAAAILKLKTGDHITLVSRLQATLRVDVVVTGTWRPTARDAFWLETPLEVGGSVIQGSYTTVGPFVIPDADLESRPFGARISYEWRGLPDPAGFRIDDVAAIRAASEQLDARIKLALPVNTQFQVATDLPKILEVVDRSVLVSRTGVLLLVIQYAVLALYAIVLVAGMLSDRRRAETALLRTRGASSGHLAAMGISEAILLTGSAALLAPFAALLTVRWLVASQPIAGSVTASAISRDALVVDAITAVIGVVALSLPLLGGGPNLAGVRAAISRQTSRTLARRLGLDLALVVVAAIALWQLRQYGAPLTRNARGVLGIDPLLVAAPAIGLLAGAVIATRILPRALEIAEGLLERSRGLVAPMGGRGLARRPLRYTRSALLLMLAASLGTFAVANVATWTRSQADQAAYQAGAAVRVAPSTKAGSSPALGPAFGAIPGVSAVMPADRLNVDAGRAVRGEALLAMDSQAAVAVANPTPGDDRAALAGLFDTLVASRPTPIGVALPAGAGAIGLVLDASFTKDFVNGDPQPVDMAKFRGIRASVVVEDGVGRYHRLESTVSAVLAGKHQRLVVDLSTAHEPAARLTAPIRLHDIELGVSGPVDIGMTGSIDLLEVDVADAASADPAAGAAWSRIDLQPSTKGWSSQVRFDSSSWQPLQATANPWHLAFSNESPLPPVFGGFASEIVIGFIVKGPEGTIDAIASGAFLEATGAKVGDDLTATLAGASAKVRVIGSVASFPTLDPSSPFLIVDDRTLAAARFAASGGIQPPTEWWIATNNPAAALTAIRAGIDPDAVVVSAADREAALLADPIPRGVIGVLGLGSWAALVFAAIGFIVSATVSTRERLGEFALLRALGLSARQLSLWLALEHTFLLTVGVLAGLGLGVVLAWLVLPFATLTTSGAAVTPPPVVVIPTASLLPILGGAAAVLVATLVVMRRQLLGIRIGDVLRAADE